MTENPLQAISSWLTADLSPGHLTSKTQLHTPQAMRNIWQYLTPQEKPSLEFNSFRNSTYLTAPILILSDSETALELANRTALNYRKAKHIDIKYHAIRHYIQEDKIQVNHVPGAENIADIFTKALGPQLHQRFVNDMGMRNIQDIIE
jgi:hypothetical protein